MVRERLSTFKSLDGGSSISSSAPYSPGAAKKVAKGLARNFQVNDDNIHVVIKKQKVEAVAITYDEEPKSLGVIPDDDSAGGIGRQAPTKITTKPDSIMQVVEWSLIEQADSNGTKTHIINEYPLPQTRPEQQQEQPAVLLSDAPLRVATSVSYCGIGANTLYNYKAADQREVSFDHGHIISIIKKLDEGWYRESVITGKFKGLKGFFPYNQFAYGPPPDVRPVPDYGERCTTWYDYKAIDKCNVSFDRGDVISSTKCRDRGWGLGLVVTGRFKGMMGYFPANCRSWRNARCDASSVSKYSVRVQASRAFKAVCEDDISFDRNDIICVIPVNKSKKRKMYGKVITGRFRGSEGYFEYRYVMYDPLYRGLIPDCGIRAVALHDHEAADKREISFRRDDIIDIIDKVDENYWYGIVITGKFKGLRGLFHLVDVAYILPTDKYEDPLPQTSEQQQKQSEVLSSDASPRGATSAPDCGNRGIALWACEATSELHLSFDQGDMILRTKKVTESLSYGEVITGRFKGSRGYFSPTHLMFEPPRDVTPVPDCRIRVRAIKASEAVFENEISFDRGDIFLTISKATETWWYGKVIEGKFKGSRGYFNPSKVGDAPYCGIRVKALSAFEAADSTEISFDPDDIIGYIEKVDARWWYGEITTGRFKGSKGYFKARYVVELTAAREFSRRMRRKFGKTKRKSVKRKRKFEKKRKG